MNTSQKVGLRSAAYISAVAFSLVAQIGSVSGKETPTTDCDRYASSPADEQRKAPGINLNQVDVGLAIPACRSALERYPDNARFAFQLGRAYQKQRDYPKALEFLSRASSAEYPVATYAVGFMHRNGLGVPVNLARAAVLFRRAAEQGNAAAQYDLGMMYASGIGIGKDDSQADIWLRKAADQGLPLAKSQLAARSAQTTRIELGQAIVQCDSGIGKLELPNNVTKSQFVAGSLRFRIAPQQESLLREEDEVKSLALRAVGTALQRCASADLVWIIGLDGREDEIFKYVYYVESSQGRLVANKAGEKQRASEQAAREWQGIDTKRDSNDVVAQVLNYTRFGKDEGLADSYYVKVSACQYRLYAAAQPGARSQDEQIANYLQAIILTPLTGGGERQIDLNDLDTRLITFQTMDLADAAGASYNRGMKVVTATKHDSKVLLFAPAELNMERLQRGWSLIYSRHCTGKRKPF